MNVEKKTVIVTGGAGLIGPSLIEFLLPKYRVVSLDNYFIGSEKNHIEGARYIKGHTKDISTLLAAEKPSIIFHLGEYSRVEQSFGDIEFVWESNVAGTFRVLEYWRKLNQSGKECKLVYAGSSTKFADGGLGRNQSPYASVMGRFKKQYYAGQPITVVAPGNQRRNFTHAEDLARGLFMVGESGHGDEYGLGSPESYSVLEIAQMFGGEIKMLPERKGNRMESVMDTSRAEKEFGWKPQHTVREYIESLKRPCEG